MNFKALDSKTSKSIIEGQLSEIHSDLSSVELEDGTNQGLLTFEDGTEMVRAEFKSESETYRLLKLYEQA
jgi:hypothetical protein